MTLCSSVSFFQLWFGVEHMNITTDQTSTHVNASVLTRDVVMRRQSSQNVLLKEPPLDINECSLLSTCTIHRSVEWPRSPIDSNS